MEQVTIFPLSSGAGWKISSDVVTFPSAEVCKFTRKTHRRVVIDFPKRICSAKQESVAR